MKHKKGLKEALEAALPSSKDETDEEIISLEDADSISAFELEQTFIRKYQLADEYAVSLKNDYVLSLCSDSSFSCIVAGLSNGDVQIFHIDATNSLQLATANLLRQVPAVNSDEDNSICGVRFLDETSNQLLVGSKSGLITLYDLRTSQAVAHFDENCVGELCDVSAAKEINCFDRNANGRVICAGTAQYQSNVFLLFYDVRERKKLGGYFESHQDDITTLRFHANNPDLLCSGATDGLINIYNIKESCEDDALQTTINTESSVQQLNWHKDAHAQDILSCITHTNDFKIYECSEGDLKAEFTREQVTNSMKRKNSSNCNLVNAHNRADNGVVLLAGSNLNKGEVLRSLYLQNKHLVPQANFQGNKQIIRESLYDAKTDIYVTAGESGIVSLWKPTASAGSDSNKLKSKSKTSKKPTPY